MRACDNCGTMGEGRFCERCGKPFPPPVPGEVHQEQVEFEPEALPQRPTLRARPTSQRIRLPAPGEPQGYAHETLRPYSSSDVTYGPPRRIAEAALTLGALSLMFCWIGGLPGLVLGVLAVYLGKRAKDEGMAMAGNAITLGYLGVGLSLVFFLVWLWII